MALAAEGLVKAYRGRRVVDEVDLRVERGEIVGLLGKNGAGKTTTFYMMVGLVRPEAGRVTHDEADITHMPMHRRCRRGLGYLAQDPSVFRNLTVRQNLLLILEMQRLSAAERNRRADELMGKLDLLHLAERKGLLLSGGERRRVEIARTLCTSPSFILLDEPFTGVDPIAIDDIKQIIVGLQSEDIGILITDHNVRETLGICHRAYIIFDGKILTKGTSAEIANDELARRYYLGESFRM
jgi:lipopolysaccharide export system ATP-binding protein